ncbi:MAG: Flp pilus assembly protein CpaB [Anaerolineae bacterium]|nr:Flp pilus assembly protein CpaB [Anaerolineae bacterium]
MKAKSSLIAIGALALITFALVAGVLSAAQKKAPVVVAARALEAGTRLSLADVQVKQVHAGAVLEGAFTAVEEVVGLVTTVQRLPGDQVTADMVGDAAQNALAQALDPGHRAVAIHVDQASGLAGLLRPGDTVSVVGIIDPSALGGTSAQRATGAGAKVLLSGLKVLFVPYEFRYRELSESNDGGGLSPVMASSGDREKGVIVLSVPVQPITVTWQISTPVAVTLIDTPPTGAVGPTQPISATAGVTGTTPLFSGAPTTTQAETALDANPTLCVSPVELLALLDSQATIYLALEPASKGDEVRMYTSETPGVYLIDLLPDLAAAQADEPETLFAGGK